ncbi:MAG: hypothetical protein PUP91_39135 [Rhizonema sp. PD37]|nr:hypothetical protein [Rhizonema sp. PD37]
MYISITDDIINLFRVACATRGLLMSQVVVGMIEQWLKANKGYLPEAEYNSVAFDKVAI